MYCKDGFQHRENWRPRMILSMVLALGLDYIVYLSLACLPKRCAIQTFVFHCIASHLGQVQRLIVRWQTEMTAKYKHTLG